MAPLLPIVLSGDNLGQRHQELNRLVNDAYSNGITLASVRDIPEQSALDRLFKIDLASKCKDVDYITQNLKHEDILYVSRALKCIWLLDPEYSEIIKPDHLENVLYPEMITTAVTKMKHWIERNLRDPERNREFYVYYAKVNVDVSLKFIWKCSEEFTLSEVSHKLLEHIEPHHLKLLIEKCPRVAEVYFENIEKNEKLKEKYLKNKFGYYGAIKALLKIKGDVFLNIIEKYFNSKKFGLLSPEATKYIMKNHKERFYKKPELYTYFFFDIKILTKHLSVSEIKDLILKLARASYLQHWFSYKKVEPLLKKLSVEERITFKKLVFVNKAFGDMAEKWPYETPSSPVLNSTKSNVFKDGEHDPGEYEFDDECITENLRCCLKKRRIMKKKGNWDEMICTRKTSLDQLFDRYRFIGFEKTLYDLRKQLNVETLQHRQNIMLVLISKSGGRTESLEELLKLLTTRHENEPENLRATVIRSLVRRCDAWRLPQNVWELILKYGRGVGLDGSPSTVACKEGLHAVIIRSLILDHAVHPAVWNSFLEVFSTLNEYSLNLPEKEKISTKLPEMLMNAAKNKPKDAVDLLEKALDTLDAYKIRVNKCLNLVKVISQTAHKNKNAEILIRRLFDARVARKELFKENFAIIQNNASYYNALKHDMNILVTGEEFETLMRTNHLAHNKFITTMSLYFSEQNGLATKYLSLLKKYINTENVRKYKLAQYIAILSRESIVEILREFKDAPMKTDSRRFAAALRANCHLARPLLNLHTFEWRSIGAKAVSNRILKCSTNNIEPNLQLLMAWSRTQKLAFLLSMRVVKEKSILQAISEKRPRFTVKIALQHLKAKKLDTKVWDIILPMIKTLSSTQKINSRLQKVLSNIEIVPENKRAEYCIIVFEVFRNYKSTGYNKYPEMPILCNIEHILPEIDPTFIEAVIIRFFTEDFTAEKVSANTYSYDTCVRLRLRIVAKYLLLCKSELELEQKWEKFGKPFFNHFEHVWNTCNDKSDVINYLDDFILSLKYTKIFLDNKYVSCLPMFERIINRLQIILPIHKCFDKFIHLHLSMLYFKSIRQGMKNNPTAFDDLPKNVNQAAEIVGRIFGKLIALEVEELIQKYFDSIIEIYKVELKEYLRTYLNYNDSWKIMVANVAKGILEHENIRIHVLAVHVFFPAYSDSWPVKEYDEVYNSLSSSKNMEVLLHMDRRI